MRHRQRSVEASTGARASGSPARRFAVEHVARVFAEDAPERRVIAVARDPLVDLLGAVVVALEKVGTTLMPRTHAPMHPRRLAGGGGGGAGGGGAREPTWVGAWVQAAWVRGIKVVPTFLGDDHGSKQIDKWVARYRDHAEFGCILTRKRARQAQQQNDVQVTRTPEHLSTLC